MSQSSARTAIERQDSHVFCSARNWLIGVNPIPTETMTRTTSRIDYRSYSAPVKRTYHELVRVQACWSFGSHPIIKFYRTFKSYNRRGAFSFYCHLKRRVGPSSRRQTLKASLLASAVRNMTILVILHGLVSVHERLRSPVQKGGGEMSRRRPSSSRCFQKSLNCPSAAAARIPVSSKRPGYS